MTGPGWPNAREVMAFGVVALFAYAFIQNPQDQTIVGALIAAFAGAWGFYLGGSKVGSDTAEKNAASVVETAKATVPTSSEPQSVVVTNSPAQPVPTEPVEPSP